MFDRAQRHETGTDSLQDEAHFEPSPELQRLARTVVSDQAGSAQEGTQGTAVELPHREQMQERFGRSFDDVRVHVDPNATSAIGARAYTLGGRDIVFASATPEPELVAHELAHVIQQREGRVGSVDSDESEAQSVAQGGDVAPATEGAKPESSPQLRK